MSGGTKHDAEKIRLDLLSTQWLNGVGKVLTFGAKKYAAHNWREGIEMSRLMGAALRHITAFNGGQDNDPETGLSHLWHASCCLMFASELKETHPQLDDRYKETPKLKTNISEILEELNKHDNGGGDRVKTFPVMQQDVLDAMRYATAGVPTKLLVEKCPPHSWDRSGEKCTKCGDKDWMT